MCAAALSSAGSRFGLQVSDRGGEARGVDGGDLGVEAAIGLPGEEAVDQQQDAQQGAEGDGPAFDSAAGGEEFHGH